MEDENRQVDAIKATGSAERHSASRRRWLKKAGMASPSLLLLANRPAMAAACSTSGFLSADAGTSLTTYDAVSCNGWSPGNWKNQKGQIASAAWNMTGISPGTAFNSVFDTAQMGSAMIRRVVDGTPDTTPVTYQSFITKTFQQELHGGSKTNSITSHAAASYLNARFLEAGGAGSNPDPWMLDYPSSADIIGLYLLYEMTHMSIGAASAGVVHQLESGGVMIGRSDFLTVADYDGFFVSIADGSGSENWQSGT